MNASTFEWDGGNLPKVARHGLTEVEVEEAFSDSRRQVRATYAVGGEQRIGVLGATVGGRNLYVVVTLRNGSIRVVTAYPARPRYRREYLEGGES
jgi:uncharacterized DUF497 family protein